jgi:preprotein translocase subunit YajC
VKETTVTIKVDTNTTVEFNKSAVTNILERKESKESAEETKE